MKLSIILPTCDVPIGSGRVCPWLEGALRSCLTAGHEDFECLVGCDGDLDSVRSMVEFIGDERIIYVPFPMTRSWGNFQRHELMKNVATGDYFSFMDHDDQYVPGSLGSMGQQIELFYGRPLFARVRLTSGVVIWIEPNLKHEMAMAGHGVFVPRGHGWPIWGPSSDRLEDHKYMRVVADHAATVKKPVVWTEQIVAFIRPQAPPEFVGWTDPSETLTALR